MKQNYESGRSMVEMLGTLAIIGVLSIGGIAGYSYGMDKYRANETINDVNLRGIDLVRQVAMGQTLSLSEWPTVSKVGYDISEPELSTEGDAYFTISGIPQRVCEMVYEGIMQNQTTDVEINGYVVDDSSTCGDDNTMGFFFITNAGEGGTTPADLCKDIECEDGYSCVSGICMIDNIEYFATNWRKCTNNVQCGICETCDYSRGGLCHPKTDGSSCGDNMVCISGSCTPNFPTSCADNTQCSFGYYCGSTNDTDSKKCIKTEVLVSYTNTDQKFYISNRAIPNQNDAIALCASINKTLINDYTNNSDIIQKLTEFVRGNTDFWGQHNNLVFSGSGTPTIQTTIDMSEARTICLD